MSSSSSAPDPSPSPSDSTQSDRITSIPCKFCLTPLMLSIPYSSWNSIITVRCGDCKKLFLLDTSLIVYLPPPAASVSPKTAADQCCSL